MHSCLTLVGLYPTDVTHLPDPVARNVRRLSHANLIGTRMLDHRAATENVDHRAATAGKFMVNCPG